MGLVDGLREDLRYLADKYHEYDGTEHDLRRDSVIVRRLLVQADLNQGICATRAPRKASLEIFPLQQALPDGDPFDDVYIGIAGGCNYGGFSFGPWVMMKSHEPPTLRRMVRQSLPVDRFLGTTCAVVNGYQVSRRHLIKYIANKQCGAHFDEGRGAEEAYRVLDTAGSISMDRHAPSFLELLSIIQAMISAPTVTTPFGLDPCPSPLFDEPTESGGETVTWPARMFLSVDRLGLGTQAARRPNLRD